jgi:ferredoxin--NADP+ reductase
MALEAVEELTVVAERDEVPAHPGADRRHELIEHAAERAGADGRVVRFRFGLEPVSVDGTDRVEAVTFRKASGELERIPTNLVLRAIGYQATPVEGLPFDAVTATLPHEAGRVLDPATQLEVTGVYCSGWVKRGPRGVIGTNKHDAEETVDTLLHDFDADRLPDPSHSLDELDALLRTQKPNLVDKQGWSRIDLEEKRRGREGARPRQKLVTIDELLAASRLGA